MRISRRKLDRAYYVIITYVLIALAYGLSVLLNGNEDIIDFVLLFVLTIVAVVIYRFFVKFLKRYQNFYDKYNIVLWIVILLSLHNLFCAFSIGEVFETSDIRFIMQLIFLFISSLLFMFFVALFNNVLSLSRKHFKLLKPLAISFLIVPIVMIISASLILLSGRGVLSSINSDYPSIGMAIIQILPFLILLKIYRQAKYVHD